VGASVIGHGIVAGNYLAKCRDSLNSLSLMYVGDGQLPGSSRLASHVMDDDTHYLWPTFLRGMISPINSSSRNQCKHMTLYELEVRVNLIPLQITCVDSHS
jgi:hypothetical protein